MTIATWTYSQIESKIRALTGRPDASMMSSATIKEYANKYYQLVLPKELKIFWGYTYYQFFAQPNVDQYVAPNDFQTLNPSVWANGFPVTWYQSPDTFYQDYPQQTNMTVIGTGDGATTSFNFTISAFPILVGSLYVTDGTQVAVDDGAGGFVSPASGTINYSTGAVSVTFATAPAANANISQNSQTYIPARPQGILFFKSSPLADATQASITAKKMFVLRPVPDVTYLIKMQGIQVPPALTNNSDVPFRADLGPLIAYGASIEIFADFNQTSQIDQIMAQYNRYKDLCMQDTYEEFLYQRSIPAF